MEIRHEISKGIVFEHTACSGKGPETGSYENCNESSSFMKDGQFVDQLRYNQLLRKDSSTWNWRKLGFYPKERTCNFG
jgi:hypothetical protein